MTENEKWPEWKKVVACIVATILLFLVGAVTLFWPIHQCFVKASLWPLLWWCIPAGVIVGTMAYSELFEQREE